VVEKVYDQLRPNKFKLLFTAPKTFTMADFSSQKLNFDPAKVRVLIVDEHDLIRKSIAKIFIKLKLTDVVECSNIAEAKQIFTEQMVDIVLCDLFFKSGSGFDFISFVRNTDANCDVPIVVVTGEAGKDDIVKASELGANDYLLKPFNPNDIGKKIYGVLDKYHSPPPLLYNIRKAERGIVEKDLKQAKAFALKALSIDPTSARANHVLAHIYLTQKDVQDAVITLKKNIENHPSFVKSYSTLANIFLSSGDELEAIRFMQSELKMNPKQPLRQIKLANLLLKHGLFKEAAEHYRAALLEDNKLKTALLGMGAAYAELGNWEKAIYYLKRARKHHPNFTKPLEMMVKTAVAADKAKIAENLLKDEKKAFPNRLDTYTVLAAFYSKTEDYEAAKAVLDEALKKKADFIDALILKGQILVKQTQYDQAIQVFNEARKVSNDPQITLNLGGLLIALGKFAEAEVALTQCMKSADPGLSKEILFRMGQIFVNTKEYGKAFFLYTRLAAKYSGNAQLNESIRGLKETLLSRQQRAPKKLVS
jgi:tetratricopeptide (TPR) repeat protein